jgi:hypothetical protein
MTTTTLPLRTGGAFALTVAIGYAACALVFWMFPQAAAGFMNALFHANEWTFRERRKGRRAASLLAAEPALNLPCLRIGSG